MKDGLKRFLVWAEISFFGFMAICIIIKPQSLGLNDGISYFGNYRETILPYIGALVVTGYFLMQIVTKLPVNHIFSDGVVRFMGIIPILMVGLIFTPSNDGNIIDWIHRFFGASIFIIELALSFYWWRLTRDRRILTFLIIEFLAGLASAIYVPIKNGFLLQTQLIFQAAFMYVFGQTIELIPQKREERAL